MRATAPLGRHDDPVIALGRRVRRRRLRLGLTQQTVADRAGVSQDAVSRMELGRGGCVDLDRWLAVTSVLGAQVVDVEAGPPSSLLEAVVRLASAGGFAATHRDGWLRLDRPARRLRSTVVRARVTPHEVVVAIVIDVLTYLEPWIDLLDEATRHERAWGPDGADFGGCLIVRRTEANRRRLRAQEPLAGRHLRGAWAGVLTDPRLTMPRAEGLAWLDARGTHLAPALPLS